MQRTKVLVVDDEHAIRRYLRTALSAHGYEVLEALDACPDDYLTKPFSVGELTARLRVAMRHARQEDTKPMFVSGKLRMAGARYQQVSLVAADGLLLLGWKLDAQDARSLVRPLRRKLAPGHG